MVSIPNRINFSDTSKLISKKNYFTPLEPKYNLKARVQRYSKIFLKMNAPITISQSPVSIKNYKESSFFNSTIKLPKIKNGRKIAHYIGEEVHFPLDSPQETNYNKPFPISCHLVKKSLSSFATIHSPLEIVTDPQKPNITSLSKYNHKDTFIRRKILQPILSKKSKDLTQKI